jgi:hypothetical protein
MHRLRSSYVPRATGHKQEDEDELTSDEDDLSSGFNTSVSLSQQGDKINLLFLY